MDGARPTSPPMDPAQRIERLLVELRGVASPQVWQRVDALMQSVVELYGEGLGRLVAKLDAAARHALAADELVASLLALHGLHPLPAETRIARALDDHVKQLGVVELTALEHGVAHLHLPPGEARLAPAQLAEALEQLVTGAAPEVMRIEVDGLERAAAPEPLVQIDLQRSRVRGGQ